MGKGKGTLNIGPVELNQEELLFEVDGVSEAIAKRALYKASANLPIKTKFIKRFYNMKKKKLKKLTKIK